MSEVIRWSAAWCALALFAGCTHEPKVITREPIGRVKSADIIPTSFNEAKKTQVSTEFAFVVVIGTPSFRIGEDAVIVTYSDGRSWLETGGKQNLAYWE